MVGRRTMSWQRWTSPTMDLVARRHNPRVVNATSPDKLYMIDIPINFYFLWFTQIHKTQLLKYNSISVYTIFNINILKYLHSNFLTKYQKSLYPLSLKSIFKNNCFQYSHKSKY